jgi:L-alanine-DL-glutamate epimerase-like enolase superfamily enzyme
LFIDTLKKIKMLQWSIEKKVLELKYAWAISRNSSDTKTNLFVNASDRMFSGIGEAAPNIRYKESPEEFEAQFNTFLKENISGLAKVEELIEILDRLKLSNALRFAVESSFVHYISKREKKNVHDFLGLQSPGSIFTAYSIPIMDIGRMKDFYAENKLSRFRFIKVKVNDENALDAVSNLSQFCEQPLIIDANEAFKDVERCIYFLERIKKRHIEFIEQPMPSSMTEESIYLKKYSPFTLFADESITNDADFSLLRKMFDGVNMKLMKAGGYANGIRLLKEAKKAGMKTMIGCMVETTLGISSAMHLCSLADYADLDSWLVIKNEPFNLISENRGELKLISK